MSAVASVTADAPPSIREELHRKSFEQLERLALQLDRGQINEAQFDTGVRTVWNCASGLVDEWLIETISEIKDRCDNSFFERRQFAKHIDGQTHFLWLTRKLGDDGLRLRGTRTTDKKDWSFKDETIPSKSAKDMQDNVTRALEKSGWKRVF